MSAGTVLFWGVMAAIALSLTAWQPSDGIPPCEWEDSPGPCEWVAQERGNHIGQSFIRDANGTTTYINP